MFDGLRTHRMQTLPENPADAANLQLLLENPTHEMVSACMTYERNKNLDILYQTYEIKYF